MRKINKIIIHCTATPEGRDISVDDIRQWHLDRGWSDIGYHAVVYLDGTLAKGRPIEKAGAHASGHNANSVGLAYVGGLDADRQPKDTRTPEQIETMDRYIDNIRQEFGYHIEVYGHRDFTKLKDCPCFDVRMDRWERRR